MIFIGLSYSESARQYLKYVRGLTYTTDIANIPVFTDDKNNQYVGGHKNIYSIILGDSREIHQALDGWRNNKKNVHFNFVINENLSHNSRLDHVLELPLPMKLEERLDIYKKRVRRYIQKIDEFRVVYKIEQPTSGWYELYLEAMKRFGSIAKSESFFTDLQKHFGNNIVCVNAYYGGNMVGVLYCLCHNDYIQFFVMASDINHRTRKVNIGLFDAAICYAIENNMRYVDFGPTMVSDEGHWALKEGFGAKRLYFNDASYTPVFHTIKRNINNFMYRIRRRFS